MGLGRAAVLAPPFTPGPPRPRLEASGPLTGLLGAVARVRDGEKAR